MFNNVKKITLNHNRKIKKRAFQKLFINKINSNSLKYNLLIYFIKSQKILLNRKIITNFLVLERGANFSLKN